MDISQIPEIQDAIALHLATGKYASAEAVILTALERLADAESDYSATLADLQESLKDEAAGRVSPLEEVAAEIRHVTLRGIVADDT
jgi:predicted transcriptional regulator